jgi:hypothetical protein
MAQREMWFPKSCTNEQRRSKNGPPRQPDVPASAIWMHEQYHEDLETIHGGFWHQPEAVK